MDKFKKDPSLLNGKAHAGVKEWHYFLNEITAADGKTFNVIINVRDKGSNQFIYEVALKRKKELESTKARSPNSSS